MTFAQKYRTEIILGFSALAWHTLWFFVVVSAYGGNIVDAVRADDGYFEIAQNVIAGNGYSMATSSPYTPTSLRTPGYIGFIIGTWALTSSFVGTALIQLLLACALPILGLRIAQYLTRSRRIGIVTGLILALDPTLTLLSFQFYTETLFLVLFYAWLLVMFRYFDTPHWIPLVFGAVLLGLATLVKTSTQFIPLIVAGCILWRWGTHEWRRGILHASLYLVLVSALLTPWIIRNWSVFGVPGLSTQSAYVVYTNFAPAVLSVVKGNDLQSEINSFTTYDERAGGAITFRNADTYATRAFAVIHAYPAASLYVAVKSLSTFFTHDGIHALLARSGYSVADFLPIVIAARLFWIGITIAAAIGGLVYLIQERTVIALVCVTLVAYFALTSMIAAFGTNPRYRLPVDPVIIAFAGVGCSHLLSRMRNFRNTV
jgi:hypothetical protein